MAPPGGHLGGGVFQKVVGERSDSRGADNKYLLGWRFYTNEDVQVSVFGSI